MNTCTHALKPLSSIMLGVWFATAAAAMAQSPATVLTFTPGGKQKPAVQSTRVDLAAGSTFSTGPAEVRELLLSDGTSIVLKPNSEMVIESINSAGPTPDKIVLRVSKGLVRIAGGANNERSPIVVNTSSGAVSLDAASALVEVGEDGHTRANLLVGRGLQVSHGGQSQTIVRPGFEVIALGSQNAANGPVRQSPANAGQDIAALSTAQLAGALPSQQQTEETGRVAPGADVALGNSITAITTEQRLGGTVSVPVTVAANVAFAEPGSVPGGTGSAGFGPGAGVQNTTDLSQFQPSQTNGDERSLTQNRENASVKSANGVNVVEEKDRDPGRTTNVLFTASEPFLQNLATSAPVHQFDEPRDQVGNKVRSDPNLQYVFFSDGGHNGGGLPSIVLAGTATPIRTLDNSLNASGSYNSAGAVLIINNNWPATGGVIKGDFLQPPDFLPLQSQDSASTAMFKGASHYEMLQANFTIQPRADVNGADTPTLERKPDNFFLLEIKPNLVTQRQRDVLRIDDQFDAVAHPQEVLVTLNDMIFRGSGGKEPPIDENKLQTDDLKNLVAAIRAGNPLELMEALPAGSFTFLTQEQKRAIVEVVNLATQAKVDPAAAQRYLFATGNVDAGRIDDQGAFNHNFQNQFAVDHFFISAGLENFDQKALATLAPGIRAFLRKETALNIPLFDSGLFVINTGSNAADAQNSLLHADFGMQGQGANQQSTLSVTVGSVEYKERTCNTCQITNSIDVVVNGRTVASSHGDILRTDADGTQTTVRNSTVAISSPLTSSAAGGGNPQVPRDGYAGYFVLQNFVPETDRSNFLGGAGLIGGTEHALGSVNTQDQKYAYLRLATGTGQATAGTRSNTTLTGWAGGLAEQENGPGGVLTIVPVGSGTQLGNVTIQTNAITNRAQVNLSLNGHPAIVLGGPNNPSAFLDDNRFAAANQNVAFVSSDMLRDANGNLPAALSTNADNPQLTYEHVRWGFFLGDTGGTPGSNLQHVHLGTWVAGRAADPSQIPSTGSARYTGHTMGNVFTGGSLYTAVGTYDNTWNFAQRSGTLSIDFDGTQYTGSTQLQNGSVQYLGSLSATNRNGAVVGNFVQAAGGGPAATAPPALAGRFAISETGGAPVYRASGTFAAQKKP